MRHLYYYVPPCPSCNSRKTGRYIKDSRFDREYAERMSYKHGEIVKFAFTEPLKNVFCCTCGYTWGYTVRAKFLTDQELEEEKEARGTAEHYAEMDEARREQYERKRKKRTSLNPRKDKAYVRKDEIIDKRTEKIEVLYFDKELIQRISEEVTQK